MKELREWMNGRVRFEEGWEFVQSHQYVIHSLVDTRQMRTSLNWRHKAATQTSTSTSTCTLLSPSHDVSEQEDPKKLIMAIVHIFSDCPSFSD